MIGFQVARALDGGETVENEGRRIDGTGFGFLSLALFTCAASTYKFMLHARYRFSSRLIVDEETRKV